MWSAMAHCSDNPEDVEGAYQHQAAGYITKPSDLDEYFTAIRALKQLWFKFMTLPKTVKHVPPRKSHPYVTDALGRKDLFSRMLHVLLVEDNPADVMLVREAVRTSPVTADLMIAYDGEQAFQVLTEFCFKPDFIFMDLTVPKLNGFEFLDHFHANQGPPVIVLTGSGDPANRQRAIDAGAKDYLVKPTDLDEFLNVVNKALVRWGKQAAARGV
jgi:CheY-like chemotaxis protein